MRHLLLVLTLAFAIPVVAQTPSLSIKTTADYLALHVTGKAPAGTAALEFRLAESGSLPAQAAWTAASTQIAEDGAFRFEVALPASRWSELQVRARKGDTLLASRETRPRADTFTLLTPARIAARPDPERSAWNAYLSRSDARARAEFDTIAAECRQLRLGQSRPAPGTKKAFEVASKTPPEWFRSAEAQKLAAAIISYQTPTGGWSKAVDYTSGPRPAGTHWTSQTGDPWHYCGTIDNGSTTEQIEFLAHVFLASQSADVRASAVRGIEWLFEAQFPNGGWPQNYPLESGYHEAITLNDDAMTHVLELLLDIAEAKPPFTFGDDALRERARQAFQRGLDCLAAAQAKMDGRLSVWGAQHDPLSLAPASARKKEPASLSGGESAKLLQFLMRRAPITPQTTAMIEPALAWLDKHRLTGLRKTATAAGKTDYVADPSSTEVYWARFYDVATARPLFAGADDGIIYATFTEMAAKNKVAYDFFTTRPRELLEKEQARWRQRVAKGK